VWWQAFRGHPFFACPPKMPPHVQAQIFLIDGFQANIKKTIRINITPNFTKSIAKCYGKQKNVGHSAQHC
jgi:hypothetical protein